MAKTANEPELGCIKYPLWALFWPLALVLWVWAHYWPTKHWKYTRGGKL